jgi:hypothetical protein
VALVRCAILEREVPAAAAEWVCAGLAGSSKQQCQRRQQQGICQACFGGFPAQCCSSLYGCLSGPGLEQLQQELSSSEMQQVHRFSCHLVTRGVAVVDSRGTRTQLRERHNFSVQVSSRGRGGNGRG